MTATTVDQVPAANVGIPLTRVIKVELRKMFDTRSGFWMMMSIAILALLATVSVIIWAPDSAQEYGSYAAAVGIPMGIILPLIAVLAVTSEWSQRTGLTTFTIVPHRSRIVWAKGIAVVIVGVASIALALVIGVLGNIIGSTLAGVDLTWDVSVGDIGYIMLGQVLAVLVGFTFGVLLRNSAAGIVAYLIYGYVLSTLTAVLAELQGWFKDLQPWVDFNFNSGKLYDGGFSGKEWSQLAVTGVIWLAIPLAFGIWRLLRAEVK